MSTITKERAKDILEFGTGRIISPITDHEIMEMARIALASLEAEPVAEVCEGFTLRYIGHGPAPKSGVHTGDRLYTAPPAPVSVADESAVELLATDLMKRIDKITGERHSLATLSSLRVSIVEACRAAMLQDAEQQNQQQNIPENIPTLRDGLAAIRSSGVAIDAEKILSERDSLNSPVIPDGWVACSERMPKKGQEVLCTDQFENYETALYDTGYIPGPPFFATTAGEFHPTHWMPLPAAPQQEVK